ncbi:muconolactone Delta-isomerase family protein [Paenarthrobacter sp. NPDC057981]|uniref:muconolactone Delta-isomerase family protein n=1 Tax=Paenarthrobacter sp. NPDC057981 TaxID=3346297 RepID=UPI0036DB0BEF
MSESSEFLVEIEIDTGDLETAVVQALRSAEAERARELINLGCIVSLWRVSGRWANVGVWKAPSEPALLELINSLPLRPYMSVQVKSLESHPSSPGGGTPSPLDRADQGGSLHVLSPLAELKLRGRPRPARVARHPQHELAPLPGLNVQRRPLPEDAGTQERDRHDFTIWVDADVTSFAKGSVESAQESIRDSISSLTLSTLEEWPALLGWTAPGETGLRLVRGKGQQFQIGSIVADPLSTSDTTASVVNITDSGSLGIGGYVAGACDVPIQLDVGPLLRTPVVKNLPTGGEGIQIRTLTRLVLSARAASASPMIASAFLSSLAAKVSHLPASD